MFDIGIEKFALLLVLALVIFGPEQLPKLVTQAAQTLRQLRRLATDVTDELKAGIGPEYADFDIADLNPRRFVAKHLLAEPDDGTPAATFPPPRPGAGRSPFDSEAT
ncbi:MAG: hypothetical protein JWR24_1241 [Actinoallomurus sp.]|nr:hypothetical protein [Actinoallomurus sp.]